jgi:hypothetical protein
LLAAPRSGTVAPSASTVMTLYPVPAPVRQLTPAPPVPVIRPVPGLAVGTIVGDGVRVAVAIPVGVRVGVSDGVRLGPAVAVLVGVRVGVAVRTMVGVRVGGGVGVEGGVTTVM